jgi:hypothetical protein
MLLPLSISENNGLLLVVDVLEIATPCSSDNYKCFDPNLCIVSVHCLRAFFRTYRCYQYEPQRGCAEIRSIHHEHYCNCNSVHQHNNTIGSGCGVRVWAVDQNQTIARPNLLNQSSTMGRKSKQAGGNLPLTHYERSKKFKAATSETVSSISQYQLGQCALTTQNLLSLSKSNTDAASVSKVLCSPSGYLYEESALLEYLLRNTRDLKRQRIAYEAQEQRSALAETAQASEQRLVAFSSSQAIVPTTTTKTPVAEDTTKALTKVSYWLDSPEVAASAQVMPLPLRDRPGSPTTGMDVKRKDFWPVALKQNKSGQLICALSDKPILMSNVVAYWTTKTSDRIGTVALASIFDQLTTMTTTTTTTTMTTTGDDDGDDGADYKKKQRRRRCPLTDARITHVRALVGSLGTTVQRIERPGLGAK